MQKPTPQAKYDKSKKAKKARRRYTASSKGKVVRSRANLHYRETIKGRAAVMCASKRLYCKQQNIPFNLTKDWYAEKLKTGCELTGIAFSYKTDQGKTKPTSPSVDRIDPAKGYLMSNCRMVLYAINMFKGAGTEGEMYYLAQQLLSYVTEAT